MMFDGVLDASVFIAYALDDEPEHKAEARSVFAALAEEKLNVFVPAHFFTEATNVLLTALNRKRINLDQFQLYLSSLEAFPIEVDQPTTMKPIATIALKHRLTIYDAAYLELAKRLRTKHLFSFDKALLAAAKAEKIATQLS